MGCAESTNQAHLPLGDTPHNHAIESCPPDSWPALQPNYKPTGTTHEVYGVKIYEAGHGKIGLVIFSDLFGIEAGRHKALADTIGSLGFNVFMPEMLSPPYNGPPGDFAKMSEAIKQQKMSAMEEKYEQLTKYLNYNDHKRFLVVSMSWGSWFAFKMSAKYDNIKAIACIHPAFMVETICGGTEQKLFESVKCPSYMALSKSEGANLRPGGDLYEILQRRFGAKAVCEDFPEMEHGFATRGDVSIETIKRDNRKAIKGVYDYLNLFI